MENEIHNTAVNVPDSAKTVIAMATVLTTKPHCQCNSALNQEYFAYIKQKVEIRVERVFRQLHRQEEITNADKTRMIRFRIHRWVIFLAAICKSVSNSKITHGDRAQHHEKLHEM